MPHKLKRLSPPTQGAENEGSNGPLLQYCKCVSEELRKTVNVTVETEHTSYKEERLVGGGALFVNASEETIRHRIHLAGRYHPIRVANGNSELRVQYLAADAKADAEANKEIAEVKKTVRNIRNIKIEANPALEAGGLVNVVKETAHIVSYCGHAVTEDGPYKGYIVLGDTKLEPGVFARVLNKLCNPGPQGNRLHGLVLNACQTMTLYNNEEFTSKPGFVIYTNKKIRTAAGVAFSVEFYNSIANGDSLLTSYYNAVLQISTAFPGDLGIHELHINESRLKEIVKEIDVATNKTEAQKREKEAEAAKNVVNAPVRVSPSFLWFHLLFILEQPVDPNYAFVLILRRVASIQ
jgi:hypothetical protein